MTAGFSSWRLTESVELDEGLGYNILERYFLNSFFINSKKGTGIYIF
jgi:hypothetical protein